MGKVKGRMDEAILVCVYYGPNGERLIRRGHKMASIIDCPLYILTIDPLPFDEFDADKSEYVEKWKELADELDVEDFIIMDNEKRPVAKVIKEVAHKHNITQIIIGQTAQSRWEEITKGSFMNVLLREITFVDFHVVSVSRSIKDEVDGMFEKGVRAYLVEHRHAASPPDRRRRSDESLALAAGRSALPIHLNRVVRVRHLDPFAKDGIRRRCKWHPSRRDPWST